MGFKHNNQFSTVFPLIGGKSLKIFWQPKLDEKPSTPLLSSLVFCVGNSLKAHSRVIEPRPLAHCSYGNYFTVLPSLLTKFLDLIIKTCYKLFFLYKNFYVFSKQQKNFPEENKNFITSPSFNQHHEKNNATARFC